MSIAKEISWIRESRNGFCQVEWFPISAFSDSEIQALRKIASNGDSQRQGDGSLIFDVIFW